MMIQKKTRRKTRGLIIALGAFLSSACLQPANEVPSLEYVPQVPRDLSANFSVAAGSDMIIVGFEGGSFQSAANAADFTLRAGSVQLAVEKLVFDKETQAVLPFPAPLDAGSYTLTIGSNAFSGNPGRLTVKAVKGDGTWSAPAENTGFNRRPIYAIAYGGGKYLAGGGGGYLSYSRDGDAWTAIPPGTAVTQSKFSQEGEVRSIAYGNGTFYAAGKNGQVGFSGDGQNWTGYSESIFDNSLSINAVIYGGNKFLAAGDDGRMMYMSDDGGWTRVYENLFGNGAIRALAWGISGAGERYVAGGDDSASGGGKLCWSADGLAWNHVSAFTGQSVTGLASGNGVFVAVTNEGKIYRSLDGETNWEEKYAVPGGTGLLSAAYGSGAFIAAGHNGVALKSDDGGDTWSPVTVSSFSTNDQIFCAAYSGGRFFLAGNSYPAAEGGESPGNCKLTAAYFKPVVSDPPVPADIVCGPFNLDAGDNQVTITLTGGAFKELPQAEDFDLSNAGFSSAAVSRDRQNPRLLVLRGITVTAPGTGKTITIKAGALSAKADSAAVTVQRNLAWTAAQNTGFDTSNIRGMAYGNNMYVAVGAGKIVKSADGAAWTEVPSPAEENRWAEPGNYVDFQGIAFGNSKFVAVGYWVEGDDGRGWGVAAVSTDGTSWTMRDKVLSEGSDSAHIYAVVWTGGNFTALGRWGRSATSADGTAWTSRQIEGFNYLDNPSWWENAYAAASDGAGKIVVGGANGKLSFSEDHGLTWTWAANKFFGEGKAIRAIAFSDNTFFAAGDGGNMKRAAAGQVRAGSGVDGGDNWSGVNSQFGESGILAFASGGGKIIAAGHNGKMSESADGSSWTALGAGTGPGQSGFTEDEQIACVVYGGGKFVSGGNAYSDKGNAAKIAYSNERLP
jgi:photosystem II stability/assembly factor-like uncharacterized protein